MLEKMRKKDRQLETEDAMEVLLKGEYSILSTIGDKYSSQFKEQGMKYIKAAVDKVSVYEISIDMITGKAKR